MKSFYTKSARCLAVLLLSAFALTPRAHSQTPPQLNLQLSNWFARLSITGDVGSGCTIQSVTNLSQNWRFVTNFTLPSNPFLLIDAAGAGECQRFYRIYSQQVPTNVVITKMVWISPGTFTMGSPDTEIGRDWWEGPQTRVTISHGFWMGKYLLTQGEYSSVAGTNPSWFNGLRYDYDPTCGCFTNVDYGTDLTRPVEQVSWNDAVVYCSHLTQREAQAGRLPDGYVYRLPTEGEWEYACRAGTSTSFCYGTALRSGMANFWGVYEYDSLVGDIWNPTGIRVGQTTPGNRYAPNAWGLYDMHGNLWEWCADWWSESLPGGSVTDPKGATAGSLRVVRGGEWGSEAVGCRSAARIYNSPSNRDLGRGFRVVLAPGVPTHVVTTNMVWISPGTFTMGSPLTEAERYPNEGPQTLVTISQGFWIDPYEAKAGEYASVMGNDFQGDSNLPMEYVSWNEAVAYCEARTTQERNAGRLAAGYVYRLPTEAEWEYACRAGTTTAFHYGPSLWSAMANFNGLEEYDSSIGTIYNPSGTSLGMTTLFGSYAPNSWGLYDLHGNVGEWCQDWFSLSLPGGSVTDPKGPITGAYRVIRGGRFQFGARNCRSASRDKAPIDFAIRGLGFRVVLAASQP